MSDAPPALAEAPADGEGLRTVVVALAANRGIAAAKIVAALLTCLPAFGLTSGPAFFGVFFACSFAAFRSNMRALGMSGIC